MFIDQSQTARDAVRTADQDRALISQVDFRRPNCAGVQIVGSINMSLLAE